MVREKVTLTLDSDLLDQLRTLVGRRSLSSGVQQAIAAYLDRLRHLKAVDEWLAEMEIQHGPVPAQTMEWAASLVEEWQSRAAEHQQGQRAG